MSIARDFLRLTTSMPFYTGNHPRVIPVYGDSHFFQSYIMQGFERFYDEDVQRYLFLHDDLILNPTINEHTYLKHFNLSKGESFLINKKPIHCRDKIFWTHGIKALLFEADSLTVSTSRELSAYDVAMQIMASHGLQIAPLYREQVFLSNDKGYWYTKIIKTYINKLRQQKNGYSRFKFVLRNTFALISSLKKESKRERYALPYPFITSNSDLVVVASNAIKKFAHYCGIFATRDLFCEIALPTALALSTQNIKDTTSLTLKYGHVWTQADVKIVDQFETDLKKLLDNFLKDYRYLHPIKLSRWICDI